jgi:hypothetical protein
MNMQIRRILGSFPVSRSDWRNLPTPPGRALNDRRADRGGLAYNATDRREGCRSDRRVSQDERREPGRRSSTCSLREAPADVAPLASRTN